MTFALVLAAFLAGSIPFGYLVARWFFGVDIRTQGSGNIGAANTMRTLGKKAGALTLALDALKGFAPVWAALRLGLGHDPLLAAALAGAAAMLGHCFSPWLGWKGGKGVATAFGALFALCWPAGLTAVVVYAVAVVLTKYSSVGSMLAMLSAPPALWWFARNPYAVAFGIFAAAFVLYTHRENVGRLRAGRENTIGLFKRG